MPGKRIAAVVAIALVAAGGVALITSTDDDAGASPRSHALKACEAADRFEAAVKRNDDIDTVNRHLNEARRQATRAEQQNSLYVGLASGIHALRVAIDRNDGEAARIGMVVVRNECGYVRGEKG